MVGIGKTPFCTSCIHDHNSAFCDSSFGYPSCDRCFSPGASIRVLATENKKFMGTVACSRTEQHASLNKHGFIRGRTLLRDVWVT